MKKFVSLSGQLRSTGRPQELWDLLVLNVERSSLMFFLHIRLGGHAPHGKFQRHVHNAVQMSEEIFSFDADSVADSVQTVYNMGQTQIQTLAHGHV